MDSTNRPDREQLNGRATMAINCSRQCPRCGYRVVDPGVLRCPRCRASLVGTCQGQCQGCLFRR